MNEEISRINELLFENLNIMENEQNIIDLEQLLIKILTLDQRRYSKRYVYDVKIKMKNYPSKFKEIYPGQIFEIYLKDIEKYTYGVVLKGNIKISKDDDIIIGYINIYSEKPLPIEGIFQNIKTKKFQFVANSGIYGIINHEWKYVGKYPVEIMDDESLNNIQYKRLHLDRFYMSVGDSIKPIGDCEIITENEAKSIPNPLGLMGNLSIENLLIENYMNKYLI